MISIFVDKVRKMIQRCSPFYFVYLPPEFSFVDEKYRRLPHFLKVYDIKTYKSMVQIGGK